MAGRASPEGTATPPPPPPPPAPQRKRKINRQPASCLGCRQRRTRCDRARPCSQCTKRNLACEYSHPPPTHLVHQLKREEYIKSLEARLQALEQQSSSTTVQRAPRAVEEPQDFTVDNLAAELSSITLGARVCTRHRSRTHQPHPLQVQLETILGSQPTVGPLATFSQPDQPFTLNLVLSNPIPSIEALCSSRWLPAKADLDRFVERFLSTTNVWAPSVNPADWTRQLDRFWAAPDRLLFRPPAADPALPPPLSQHYLAHFLSTIYSIAAHGLLAFADIHNLRPSQSPPQSSPPSLLPDIASLSQSQKISQAHRWFSIALGLLTSPVGNIYIKPTVDGVRAMSLLSNVELAPENLDHGIYFWSLTANLATSVGLLREPPLAIDEDLATVDDSELESRRLLAWNILNNDWAGYAMSGGRMPCREPQHISVKIPGTVLSPSMAMHPVDGWPLDPVICLRRVYALICRIRHTAQIKILNGRSATYLDVLDTQKQLIELENSLPPRFQLTLSPDGTALQPLVQDPQVHPLLLIFLCARFCVPRVSSHRLFISPKRGVGAEERVRQLKMLLSVSKRQFLAIHQTPHYLNMHPLLIYSLVNTAVACALVLLIKHQVPQLVIEEEFFLTELKKVIDLFDLGQRTMAVNMARKAVKMLRFLVEKIEDGQDRSRRASHEGGPRKKGPWTGQEGGSSGPDDGEEGRRRKRRPEVRTQHEGGEQLPTQPTSGSSKDSSICSPRSGHPSYPSPAGPVHASPPPNSLDVFLHTHLGHPAPALVRPKAHSASAASSRPPRPPLPAASASSTVSEQPFDTWWPLGRIVSSPPDLRPPPALLFGADPALARYPFDFALVDTAPWFNELPAWAPDFYPPLAPAAAPPTLPHLPPPRPPPPPNPLPPNHNRLPPNHNRLPTNHNPLPPNLPPPLHPHQYPHHQYPHHPS